MKIKNDSIKYILSSLILFILLGIILYYIVKKYKFEYFENFVSIDSKINMEDIGSDNPDEFPPDPEVTNEDKQKLMNCQNGVGSGTENSNIGLTFKFGTSGIDKTGSIRFTTPFKKPPMIQTQIIVDQSSNDSVYSINIFNITKDGFDYNKQKVVSVKQNGGDYVITKIDSACNEKFNWTAIGN